MPRCHVSITDNMFFGVVRVSDYSLWVIVVAAVAVAVVVVAVVVVAVGIAAVVVVVDDVAAAVIIDIIYFNLLHRGAAT